MYKRLERTLLRLGTWHTVISVPIILVGVGNVIHSGDFVNLRRNPLQLNSLAGYLGAGIWAGVIIMLTGILNIVINRLLTETIPKPDDYYLRTVPDADWDRWASTHPIKRRSRSVINLLGFLAAAALFAICFHSTFLNNVHCPLDNYVIKEVSNSTTRTASYYGYRTTDRTTTTTESTGYKWNTYCKLRNELVGLDATLMVFGLVSIFTMAISFFMTVATKCCLKRCCCQRVKVKYDGDGDGLSEELVIMVIQISLSATNMIFGIAATVHQDTPEFVLPDRWSLNGFVGTGMWSGAILIIICAVQIKAGEKNRIHNFVLHVALGIMGVIVLLATIGLSIVSAFITNYQCSFDDYSKEKQCQKINVLVGLDISTMVVGVIQLVILSVFTCKYWKSRSFRIKDKKPEKISRGGVHMIWSRRNLNVMNTTKYQQDDTSKH